MLLRRANGEACFRCAYRARLQILQQARQKRYLETDNRNFKVRRVVGYGHPRSIGPRASGDGGSQTGAGSGAEAWSLEEQQERKGQYNTRRPWLDFQEAVRRRMSVVKEDIQKVPFVQQLVSESDGSGTGNTFQTLWRSFALKVTDATAAYAFLDEAQKEVADDLRRVYMTRSLPALDSRIKYSFYGHVTNARFTQGDIENQKALADLRYPNEWFPATRVIQRTVHLHVGPTNSGKTYQALQRLEKAESGFYAGPLRLLAHEVYTRLNAKGIPCGLATGEERRTPPDGTTEYQISAYTVEMVPLNYSVDVAVIDEIQMIGSSERGWAWTEAVLGVKAKELHLCGEERTVPIIRELCASIGDKLVVHRYKRLSPLRVADASLDGDLSKLRKGDCIVSFSVMGIHALRRQIEQRTKRKVATVYGSLPPETRAQQARLFNDPNNDYDFLVASDAVGMGLNLAIKRVIFETITKFDGAVYKTLDIADIKQIGGRAGRFRTALQAAQVPASEQDLAAAKGDLPPSSDSTARNPNDNIGLVTTLEKFDYPIVRSAMSQEPEPIATAGIFPPTPVLERFANYFPPGTPFSYLLTRLHELSQVNCRFHLCSLRDYIWMADIIEPVQGLTITDRSILCLAPASKADENLWRKLLPAYARCVANQKGGSILDIKELPLEVLDAPVSADRTYLTALERLHKGIVSYLWLSFRFAGIFNTRPLAMHVKSLVEEKIETVLNKLSFSESARRKLTEAREKRILRDLQFQDESLVPSDVSAVPIDAGGHAEEPLQGERQDTEHGGMFHGRVSDDFIEADHAADQTLDEPAVTEDFDDNETAPNPGNRGDRLHDEEDTTLRDVPILDQASQKEQDITAYRVENLESQKGSEEVHDLGTVLPHVSSLGGLQGSGDEASGNRSTARPDFTQ